MGQGAHPRRLPHFYPPHVPLPCGNRNGQQDPNLNPKMAPPVLANRARTALGMGGAISLRGTDVDDITQCFVGLLVLDSGSDPSILLVTSSEPYTQRAIRTSIQYPHIQSIHTTTHTTIHPSVHGKRGESRVHATTTAQTCHHPHGTPL